MSEKWQHIRARLVDLGWNTDVLDTAEAEVRGEGYTDGWKHGQAACAEAHPKQRRRKVATDDVS